MKGFRLFLWMFFLTGIVYPLVMTGIAFLIFPYQAKGSLLERHGSLIGSMHIGQKFEQEKYFWSRPSATDYNTLPASGSNLGPTSALLQRQVEERRAAFQSGSVPSELLFCSGSGLDPHLTLEGIYFQIERVAKARQLDPDQLKRFVDTYIIKRHFGLLGDHLINVLLLNQALDEKEEKIE